MTGERATASTTTKVQSMLRKKRSEAPRFSTEEEFAQFWEDLEKDQGQGSESSEDSAEQGADASTPEERFELAYSALIAVMDNRPAQREALYRVLALCIEPHAEAEVEAAIEGYPEFPMIMQPAYRLVKFLLMGGGLERFGIDEAGEIVSPERAKGLSEDELDDLVNVYMLRTTATGRVYVEENSPEKRMEALTRKYPDRLGLYAEVLEFCKKPCTFSQIEELLTPEKIEGIRTFNYEPGAAMKPSVFVDNLEQAAALVWEDRRWHITEDGIQFLKAIKK